MVILTRAGVWFGQIAKLRLIARRTRPKMKRLCLSLAVLAGFALLLGFFGSFHPMLDSIAIGRRVAIYGLLIFLFLAAVAGRSPVFAMIFLCALVLNGVIAQLPDGEEGSLRIYTKNLLHSNANIADVVADIQQANPDVVFLQEVSDTNKAIMTTLQDNLPYQAICPWQGWNGAAVLSRWPLAQSQPRCSPQRSLIAVKLARPAGDFWAVGVHLQQPWPDVQWAHLEAALPVIDGLDAGAVVAGDFNTVPWTAAARLIGDMTGTRPVQPQRPTFFLQGVGLPLDQVWALGGRAQIRPQFGSDHHGVVADVWPSAN